MTTTHYRLSEPKRGDVVVFRTRGLPGIKQDTYFIKRLAGLPGETLGPDEYLVLGDTTRYATRSKEMKLCAPAELPHKP